MVTLLRLYYGWLMPGCNANVKLLQILLNLLTRLILFTLPGFKLSTLGSATRDTPFLHYAKLDWAKEEGWTSTKYIFVQKPS